MELNQLFYLMDKSSSSDNKSNQNSSIFFAFFPFIVSLFERFLVLVQGVHSSFPGFWSFFLFQLHSSDTDETCSTDLKTPDFVDSPVYCSQGEQDHDGGSLLREEIETVMKNLTLLCGPGDQELPEKIGSREVTGLFEEKEPSLEEVKEAFDVYDQNKDGFIDARELQRVLRALGMKEGFALENCRIMIEKFDDNGDGMIDFREFVKFMENSFFDM